MWSCFSLSRCTLVCVLSVGCHVFASDNTPWDGPAFEGDPSEIARAVGELPEPDSTDVEILLFERLYRFDAEGRMETRLRVVQRFLSRSAIEDSAAFSAEWAPWYQQRPELRARVVTPDGEAHELDPATVGEAPVDQTQQNIFSDRRVLQAPLPALEVGAVVERETIVREHRPFFDRGIVQRLTLGSLLPCRILRVTIDAPETLPLRYHVLGSDITPTRTEVGGRVNLVFDPKAVRKIVGWESLQSREAALYPEVVVSTGESWIGVAASYSDVVDEQLAGYDLKALARQAVGRETEREQIAAALLNYVQRSVRYTGVSFGEAAIVPGGPEQTLRRRYGDCKDQSTLLVGLLRAVGVEAYVALLNVGGAAVIPELPGLSAFNHAIVYVPGETPLWIDPTMPYTRVGDLPVADQARWSLVASKRTMKLVRTPKADSRQTRTIRHRRIQLAFDGTARTTYSTEKTGILESEAREIYAGMTRQEVRQRTSSAFTRDGGKLVSIEYPDPSDLNQPFRVVVEATDVPMADVTDQALSIPLYPSPIFTNIPYFMQVRAEEKRDEDQAADSLPRQTPLVLPMPHQYEMHFHVSAPDGYRPASLPENKTEQIGQATISRSFKTEDDGSITARFRFDSGSGTYSPADIERLREAIAGLTPDATQEWSVTLQFDHIGTLLLQQGKIKESLAEFRRLTVVNPDDSNAQREYAWALLSAGFGDAARRHARRAVELDPDSSNAQFMLGTALCYDRFGRKFQPGFDRAGAAAALKRSLELQDGDLAGWNYVALLERDEFGRRFSTIAHIEEAAAVSRTVLESFPEHPEVAQLHASQLLCLGRFQDLRKHARTMPASLLSWGMRLAAIAGEDGADAARAHARTLPISSQQQTQALLVAVTLLDRARVYGVARDLRESGSRPAALDQLKRFEEIDSPAADDPAHVVLQLNRKVVMGDPFGPEIASLFHPNTEGRKLVDELRRSLDDLTSGARDRSILRSGDAVSVLTFETDGDDNSGFRVRTKGLPQFAATWFVLRVEDSYRIWDAGDTRSRLGERALELLDGGDSESARRLVGWAFEEQRSGVQLFDIFAGSPFARYWLAAGTRGDDDQLRIAASLLASSGTVPHEQAVRTLEQGDSDEENDVQRLQIQRGLLSAYLRTKRFDDARKLIDGMREDHPTAQSLARAHFDVLIGQGEEEKAGQFLRDLLKKRPKEAWVLFALGRRAARAGDFASAKKHLRAVTEQGPDHVVLNSLAWMALFVEPFQAEEAISDALLSTKISPEAATFHTLATVYAESGKPGDAYKALLRAMALRGSTADHDWFVVGRIAEHYGLPEVAASAYQQVLPAPIPDPLATHILAQRRLEILMGAKPEQ